MFAPSQLRRAPPSAQPVRPRVGIVPVVCRLLQATLVVGLTVGGAASAATAQTISGTLLELDTDRPIPLGLVMMFTTEGDSITATVSDPTGRFQVTSPEPGSFLLIASALGYEETPAGVFELGTDGEMQVEYRLPSRPLPVDEVLVSIDRPAVEHHLVQNGFVRRLQRGLGHHITPYQIERSSARSTEALMEGIPQVRVGSVTGAAGGLGLPMPHLGEAVQIMGPTGGWCTPHVYVDGMPMRYAPGEGFTLDQYAARNDVEAIEVYRRAAEIPVEFAAGVQQADDPNTGCGLILVWTKRGLGAGQRPEFFRVDPITGETIGLPEVDETGAPPVQGETIRLELGEDAARSRGITSPWQGTFEAVDGEHLVAVDDDTGQPVALPVEAVSVVQVARRNGPLDAWRRGLLGGAAIGAGTWAFLELLCEWTCGDPGQAQQETVLPGVIAGLAVGGVLVSRGPGSRWVRTSLADSRGSAGPVGGAGSGRGPAAVRSGRGGFELGPGPLPGALAMGWRLVVR